MERIELCVKEIGEIDGKRVMCVESTDIMRECRKVCAFRDDYERCVNVKCTEHDRLDNKTVYFIYAPHDPIANLREDTYSNEFEK